MGLFNAWSSINQINGLLKDLENQVAISQGQVERNAPKSNLINSLNVHNRIHQELINAFSGSGGARVAVYTLFGEKVKMDDILTYSKNLICNLNSIIKSI